jgi:hypothetical protein
MKKQLIYLLLVTAALATGCLKDDNANISIPEPQGNFSGKFIRAHINPRTLARDTVRLNIQMELTGNTFKITGDTSVHAGSKGTFQYNQSLIQWTDTTVPAGTTSVNLPKYHLNGIYQYNYNGTDFKFAASNDTLTYYYELKKAN